MLKFKDFIGIVRIKGTMMKAEVSVISKSLQILAIYF